MRKRQNRPPIPPVPLELWLELYAAAAVYQQVAPWTWMWDSNVLGVQTHEQARILCVLGRNKEMFGLVAYRGTEGIRQLFNLVAGTVEPADHGQIYGQYSLIVDYEGKSGLDPVDKDLLQKVQYQPPCGRRRRYPAFRSYLPGYVPWFINETEAQILRHDLRCMTEFSLLYRQHPDLFDRRRPNEVPFYPAKPKGALTADQLEWHQILVPEPPKVEAFVPDPAQAKEVAQLPPHPQLKIELDAFWTSTQIGDGPRPWFAKLALAVDAASGIIFQFEMESPDISLPATAGRCLLKTLPALGCRPAVVYVSPSLFESLAPLVAATGICFKPVPDLPMIEVARSELEPQLGC